MPHRTLLGSLAATLAVIMAGCSSSFAGARPAAPRASSSLLRKAAHWQAVRVSDGGVGKPAPEDYREIQFTDAQHGWLLADTNPKLVSMGEFGSGVTYTRGVLLRTTDGGGSWQAVYTTTTPGLSFSFANNDVGWLAFENTDGYSVTARTLDGGRTWSKSKPQTEGPEQICALSDHEAWGIARGGGYPIHSVDGGASWAGVKLPSGVPEGGYKQYKQAFFLDRQHGWVVGERTQGGENAPLSAVVLRTRDGGKTFQAADTPTIPFRSAFSSYRLRFRNPDEGWLTFAGTLLHTTDGGATWSPVDAVTADFMNKVVDCFFASSRDGWAVGQRVAPLALHTRDGGKTWSREQTGAQDMQSGMFSRVVFTDASHGWLIGQGGTPPLGKPNAGHTIQFVLRYVP